MWFYLGFGEHFNFSSKSGAPKETRLTFILTLAQQETSDRRRINARLSCFEVGAVCLLRPYTDIFYESQMSDVVSEQVKKFIFQSSADKSEDGQVETLEILIPEVPLVSNPFLVHCFDLSLMNRCNDIFNLDFCIFQSLYCKSS